VALAEDDSRFLKGLYRNPDDRPLLPGDPCTGPCTVTTPHRRLRSQVCRLFWPELSGMLQPNRDLMLLRELLDPAPKPADQDRGDCQRARPEGRGPGRRPRSETGIPVDVARRQSDIDGARSLYGEALHLDDHIPKPCSIGATHQRLARIASSYADRALTLQAARAAWPGIDRADSSSNSMTRSLLKPNRPANTLASCFVFFSGHVKIEVAGSPPYRDLS